jgi:hypothetical protein
LAGLPGKVSPAKLSLPQLLHNFYWKSTFQGLCLGKYTFENSPTQLNRLQVVKMWLKEILIEGIYE